MALPPPDENRSSGLAKILLLAVASYVTAMHAQAQWANGIYIPGPGASMPNYWSGTNCRASGFAQIGGPIYSAELFLNGELVNEWDIGNPIEEEAPWSLSHGGHVRQQPFRQWDSRRSQAARPDVHGLARGHE